MHNITGLPIIHGEFAYTAIDSGVPNLRGARSCAAQSGSSSGGSPGAAEPGTLPTGCRPGSPYTLQRERAAAAETEARKIIAVPYLVGCGQPSPPSHATIVPLLRRSFFRFEKVSCFFLLLLTCTGALLLHRVRARPIGACRYHWWRWADESPGGRWPRGENSNYGLVRINNEAYPEITQAFSRVNADAPKIHATVAAASSSGLQ